MLRAHTKYLREIEKALRAIAEGYLVKGENDRYVVVENPDFQEPDIGDPNLVVDVHGFFDFIRDAEQGHVV